MLLLEITDGSGNLLDDARERLFAYVFYPDDEPQRRAFLGALSLESTAELMQFDASGELTVQATARIAPRFEKVVGAAARDGAGSAIAGELVLLVLNLALFRPHEASVRRARQIIAHEYSSERPLKRAWREFKSISPFAAALSLHRDLVQRGERSCIDPLSWKSLPAFLAVADILRARAVHHHAPVGRTGSKFSLLTLLDPEATWAAPRDLVLPTVTVGVPDLTEFVVARLKHYAARPKLWKNHRGAGP